ncbi:MAG: glycosyltransferase, partial [Anaerolineae bacterium]
MLLPAPTYLPSRRANTIQVMKMAQAFTRLGQEVHLTVPNPQRRPPVDWEVLARHYGVQERFSITWLPAHPRLRSYDYAWQVLRLARRENVPWIFTRHPQAAAFASLQGIPTVLEVHDLPQGRVGPLWFRLFLRGRGARALVTITRALRDALPLEGWPHPVLVLPDGVDLERYAGLPAPEAARATLGLPPRFTAGYTGHLYAGRGVELLLSLAARLPEMTFLLAGGNPEDVARLKAQAAGLDNLIFTGFIPNAELPRYQAACDVLLMPYQ